MTKRVLCILAACCLFGGTLATAAAQDASRTVVNPQTNQPEPAKEVGQPVAVRIEVTISDQVGTAAPLKKVVTLLAADRERASVRSTNIPNGNAGTRNANFYVDARPTLVQDKIHLDLSVFFDPEPGPTPTPSDSRPSWLTSIQETVPVIVENGKPLVISQSADPRTDRKVTIEVKATVLK